MCGPDRLRRPGRLFELQDRNQLRRFPALEYVCLTATGEGLAKASGSPLVYEHFSKAWKLLRQVDRPLMCGQKEHASGLIDQPWIYRRSDRWGQRCRPARFGCSPMRRRLRVGGSRLRRLRPLAGPAKHDAYMIRGTPGHAWSATTRRPSRRKAVALSPISQSAYHMAGIFHGYAGDYVKPPRRGAVATIKSLSVNFYGRRSAAGFIWAFRRCPGYLCGGPEKPRRGSRTDTLIAALWNLWKYGEAHRLPET